MPNITVNGAQLNYEDTGKGKPIVFLHGYVGSIEDFRHQIQLLSPKYRCLALDQRGRGKGVAPKKESEYTFDLLIDDVYQWLKQIKVDKCVLNGHSMGGMVSQGFTLAHPEMVTGLVLAATSSGLTPTSDAENRYFEKLADIAMQQGTLAVFNYDLEHNPGTKARYAKHPETLERMREMTRTTSPEGYVYARRLLSDGRPVYTDRLWEIECPVLAISGDDDFLLEQTKVLACNISNSDFVLVKNSGHGVMYEQPEQYNSALVKFLKKIKY